MQQGFVRKADGTLAVPVRPAILASDNRPIIMNGIAFYEFGAKPQPDLRERIELVGEELTDYGIIAPWIPSIWYKRQGRQAQQTPQRTNVTGNDHYIDLITRIAGEKGAHVVVEVDKFGERDFAKTSQVQFYMLKPGATLRINPDPKRCKQQLFALGTEFSVGDRMLRLYGRDEVAPECEDRLASADITVVVHMDDALEAANPIIKEESASWFNRQTYLAAVEERCKTLEGTIAIERAYDEGYASFVFRSQGGSHIDYKMTGTVEFYR